MTRQKAVPHEKTASQPAAAGAAVATPSQETAPAIASSWSERNFARVLTAIIVTGAIIRCIILAAYIGTPLSKHPINDARVYWEWAGDIAAGNLTQNDPFFSAPLYPYLLGAVRWIGAQPALVYFLQMLGDLTGAALLAWLCRPRFGSKAALLAAALYLLLLEPASSMLRVLASSLHLLLVILVWAAMLRVQQHPSWSRLLALGAALGLLTLAYAPAILLLPLVAAWLFVVCGRKLSAAAQALLPVIVSAVIIAPAAIHNWRATGGFFPVQAGGGITLLQGNHPSSKGSYTVIPGVSGARELMHKDTQKVYHAATGREPKWVDVDRYFRDQALDLWRSQPAKLLELMARKFYAFVSSRHYADIYQPTSEIAEGINWQLRLAPLPLPWLIVPALVGLVLMLRKPLWHAPEWMLFAIPLLVVMTFFYSPRYRVPAIPIIVIMAAWTFALACDWRRHWAVLAAAVAALVIGMSLERVNGYLNVDRPHRDTTLFNQAHALRLEHRLEEAIDALRLGLAVSPTDWNERLHLGEALAEAGRPEEAAAELRQVLTEQPHEVAARMKLARCCLDLQRVAEADELLSAVADQNPPHPELLALLAHTKHLQKQTFAACVYFEQALEAAPDNIEIRTNYGNMLIDVRRWDGARTQFEKILELDPDNFLAGYRMGVICGRAREFAESRRLLDRALQMRPNQPEIIYDLGVLEMIQGHREEAALLFNRVLELAPNYKPAHYRLRELAERGAAEPGG